jgi:hypothetical protein
LSVAAQHKAGGVGRAGLCKVQTGVDDISKDRDRGSSYSCSPCDTKTSSRCVHVGRLCFIRLSVAGLCQLNHFVSVACSWERLLVR